MTKISKWLGWQNQFSDIYVSNPPLDTKKNDLIFTTGLNFSFTPESDFQDRVQTPLGRAAFALDAQSRPQAFSGDSSLTNT